MSARGRESTRQFRARFAGCLPVDISLGKWARDRRLSRGRFKRTRGALGVRSRQALNLMGVRIWVDKPRIFGGKLWLARCATIARHVERDEARAWRAVAYKWASEGWI